MTMYTFARSIAGLALAAIAGCAAAATDKAWGPYSYDTIKVADNIYAFIEPKMNPIVSGNIIAVIGTESILVFDSGHHAPITRAVIGEIKHLSDKPVRYVVVSHWHDDHWVGNAEFAAAYPDVHVIAHPFTAEHMQERAKTFAGARCKSDLEKQAKDLRDRLAGGKKRDGSQLSDENRQILSDALSGYDVAIQECDDAHFRGADLTFESTLQIQLGGRVVELSHLGRGNTAGDVVAYIPDAKTLLTGDVLVFPFPFATQSYITEWAAVLRKLDAIDARTIVPGHGAVLHDKQYLEDMAAMLENISAQAHKAYVPGMSADELRKKIDISALSEKFSHGDDFIKANFDYMVGGPAIDRLWQELSGKWKSEGE
jgi:cyclase